MLGVLLPTRATPQASDAQKAADIASMLKRTPNGSWDWGMLFFGQEYGSSLDITNDCGTKQTAEVFLDAGVAPYLEIDATHTVSPKTTVMALAIIRTPRAPTAPPPAPAPPPGAPPGSAPPPPTPAYLQVCQPVAGRVLIKAVDLASSCFGEIQIYEVSGHIHRDPAASGDGGSPCLAWWMAGEMPPNATQDCTTEFRALARHYLDTTLKPLVEAAPGAWAWLPAPAQLAAMKAPDLLAMKKRAEEQRKAQQA
jgi:hypothetical protein